MCKRKCLRWGYAQQIISGFYSVININRLSVMKVKGRILYCPIAGKYEISEVFKRASVKLLCINMLSEKQSLLYLPSL